MLPKIIVRVTLIVGALFPLFAAAQPTVVKLTLRDTIQPISAEYLDRGISHAAQIHASAVLIDISTPGGLLDSTRDIVESIERSSVPVIVFVSPTGSRAASAGFFILEAADIAAMAPGTNTGAAHPILEGTTMDPVLKLKLENDAAAFLRSYTLRRGRNMEAAEDAVRNSKSYSDSEALTLHLINLTANDDSSLLAALDGRSVPRFIGDATILHLHDAQVVPFDPTLRERILGALTNPNLAVLLLVLGGLLIYLEFNTPGTIVPGSLGALLVLLSFFALNLLPIHYTAIGLLVAAFTLMLLEAKFPSHGILALSGTATLVFALLTLVDGPIPEQRVHLSTALAAGIGFGLITSFLAVIAMRARRNKVRTGAEGLLGQTAIARTPLAPEGQVVVHGEIWSARLCNPSLALPTGAAVRILSLEALTLLVEPVATARETGATE